jgi:hypothetical protein
MEFGIETGQYVGWGVAPGGINVPFAIVSVSVDPPTPLPELVLRKGEADKRLDAFAVVGAFEPALGPVAGTCFELVVPAGLLLVLLPLDGGAGEPQSIFAAEVAPPPLPEAAAAAACDKVLREFSACGIYVLTPAMSERR